MAKTATKKAAPAPKVDRKRQGELVKTIADMSDRSIFDKDTDSTFFLHTNRDKIMLSSQGTGKNTTEMFVRAFDIMEDGLFECIKRAMMHQSIKKIVSRMEMPTAPKKKAAKKK